VTTDKSIATVAELLAHAKAIEEEALERYQELAQQMEVHHNEEVAALFRKMAHVEGIHVQKVLDRVGDMELPHISPWDFRWLDEEAPESITATDVHYLMTPHHALKLALRGEQRAFDFFSRVCETVGPSEVCELARELMEEEKEHIQLMQEWLARVPLPDEDWDEDPDPPTLQE